MRVPGVALGLALAVACGGRPELTGEQLLDPDACALCHPLQFGQWSQSMHAGAADDPVFVAMNRRGQRDTRGQLGSFCVQCHAPMALAGGATEDGLDLEQVPRHLRGVTCVVCHTVESIEADHNNGLVFGRDLAMRGPSRNAATRAHSTAYSPLLDRRIAGSARLCGSCHDVVVDSGLRVERTFLEWNGSLYAGDSCARCHMEPAAGVADHRFAAVDLASDSQRPAVLEALAGATQSALCVEGSTIRVVVQTRKVGHAFPSGAAHNRRLWAEVIAYREGEVIYQSGVVNERTPVVEGDAELWLMRDCLFDEHGRPVRMMWEAASHTSNALPPRVPVARAYGPLPALPDRVTLRLRLRPVGLDVLDDLVASGDLDPAVRDRAPTFDLDLGDGPTLEWSAGAEACVSRSQLTVPDDPVPASSQRRCADPSRNR